MATSVSTTTNFLFVSTLLLWAEFAAAQQQESMGDCSPNVANVGGDVSVDCGLSFKELSELWLRFIPEQWIWGHIGTIETYDAAPMLKAAFRSEYSNMTCMLPDEAPEFIQSVTVRNCSYVVEFAALPLGTNSDRPVRIGEVIDYRTTVPVCHSGGECFYIPVAVTFHNKLPPRPFNMRISPDPVPDQGEGRLEFTYKGSLVPEGITCKTKPEIGKPGDLGQKFIFLEEFQRCQFVIWDLGEKFAKSKVSFVDRLGRELGYVFVEDSGR